MTQRAFVCLAVSTCLLACLGKTTSLGGPQDDQSTASSTDADGGADSGISAASGDGTDSGTSAASGDAAMAAQPLCAWYSWTPVPTTVACEYLLPSDDPNNDPNFDPKTWDPHNVRVEFGAKYIGQYAATAGDCRGTGGWYAVDPAAGPTSTRFMLCPASCARVASDGAFLRLSASSCH
jgi:hypothetical protein